MRSYRFAITGAWVGLLAACNVPLERFHRPDGGRALAQQAYVKASNTDGSDGFGARLVLSADGSTLAVAAVGEASAATGIDGDQADDSLPNAGAVYVFTQSDTAWSQQAYVKASNTGMEDRFGSSLALSADGSTLAVGAPGESSSANGQNGNQNDNSAPSSGAVYVFTRIGMTWVQQAYLKGFNSDTLDAFGASVALSADGKTLAIGAAGEASAATGVGGDDSDDSAPSAGAVYVYRRTSNSTIWILLGYLKASNTDAGDRFGSRISLSADGTTLAVAARDEDSAAFGAGGNQMDDSAENAGAVYVFTRDGGWSQQAYLKASNTDAGDLFGASIALSGDGSTLAVGAPLESSAATGIDGDQADDSAVAAGAAYVFRRDGTTWRQHEYLKASNADPMDHFGAVALSGDGSILAVGAGIEASAATGIGGNQADNTAQAAGAVYLFVHDGVAWGQQAYVKASNTHALSFFGGDPFTGASVALSGDGSSLAVGADSESSAATGINGDQSDRAAAVSGAVYVFR